jgi:hypothetical protein
MEDKAACGLCDPSDPTDPSNPAYPRNCKSRLLLSRGPVVSWSFFAPFAPFCGNSSQVTIYQQLTTKIEYFQLTSIKPN